MNKENTCKSLFFLLLIFIAAGGQTYAQNGRHEHSVVNWGIRAGLNALSTNHYRLLLEGAGLDNKFKENNIGYSFAGYARINLDDFFMQPELSWNIYRQNFSFALPDEDETVALQRNIMVRSCVGASTALVGYNIVKDGPYLLSFVTGPSLRCAYNTNYKTKGGINFTDKKLHYSYTGIVGFSVSISKFHFDIRYEFNKPHTNVNFNDIANAPELFNDISIQKNENILGFSCGLMF